jgi:hypothetical protein
MRTFSAATGAPPEVVWDLLARPEAWKEWSPHLRGAWGLGAPEVREGATGAAALLGLLPVPARITAKRDGRSWTWRVGFGVVELVHRVEPRTGGGSLVAVDLIAPGPVERALALGYGPLVEVSLRRLAHAAEGVVGAPAREDRRPATL